MSTKTILAAGALMLALGMLGGCKNVCQKAGQHYLDCWQEYCDAHADDSRCESRLQNPMAQVMVEADSCPNEDRANQILEATCEQLTAEDGPGL